MENCLRKNPKTAGILTIVGLALSGCMNGATTPAPPPDVTKIFVGDLDATTSVPVSSDGNQLDISNGGGSVALLGVSAALPPGINKGFSLYYDSTATVNAFAARATTHSGAGVVTVMVAPALGLPGSIVEGTGTTSLPTNGTASFTGGYLGLTSTTIGALHSSIPIFGIADLNADFATLSISGTISRRLQTAGGLPTLYAPIVLNPATIQASGTFSGTATGGENTPLFPGGPVKSTSGGGFKGVLVGNTGNEVVGGIYVDHNISGASYFENGIFVAN